jgi:hypothetical protein
MNWRVPLLLAVLLAQLCPAAELRDLKVLYVGNATSARAADFKAFLSTNVAQVTVASRASFDPALANQFDVVVMDWPPTDPKGEFPPKWTPLGKRNAWTKPTVLVGRAGMYLAYVWDIKGAFG